MAILENRLTLSIEDLEEHLGALRLPRYVREAEDAFLERTHQIAQHIASHPRIRAVFVSGPTSSGKTTFTDRLITSLLSEGKKAMRVSLDDYYSVEHLQFDKTGRPDYESLTTIDTQLACENIKDLLAGRVTTMPVFDFNKRIRADATEFPQVSLDSDGLLIVEGLHGLSPEIAGLIPRELWLGIFIMPWGEVVADRRLIESQEVRLLRRIIRDVRHRGAHALATLDYWPMIAASELNYFPEYLASADFYVNSLLSYESMVVAPIALADIKSALAQYEQNTLAPSVFLAHAVPAKPYADLSAALVTARKLVQDLSRVPSADPRIVPAYSILNEFL
jgi:uridine kinase